MRVLCADDKRTTLEVMRLFLESAGFEVTTAGDGEEAWKLVESQDYDVLVTNRQMPGLDGKELVQRVRASGSSLPVVVCYGLQDAHASRDMEGLGVGEFLAKPYSQLELLAAVKRALGHSGEKCAKAGGLGGALG